MIDLSVRGLVKGFEQGNDILKGITFDVNAGERVGILGRNGCGKTTFFRILSGELQPDAGTVSIAAGRRLGLISQIPVYPDGWTTEDVLREAHRRLYDMEARMNELTARMASDNSPALLAEYDRLSENFRRLGGYDMEHERNRVANGLDIPAEMRAQPFDSLSGGEKTRVNLARLILEDTDILLLDEPTNHLDLRATEWLETYLLHFRGTVRTAEVFERVNALTVLAVVLGFGRNDLGFALDGRADLADFRQERIRVFAGYAQLLGLKHENAVLYALEFADALLHFCRAVCTADILQRVNALDAVRACRMFVVMVVLVLLVLIVVVMVSAAAVAVIVMMMMVLVFVLIMVVMVSAAAVAFIFIVFVMMMFVLMHFFI